MSNLSSAREIEYMEYLPEDAPHWKWCCFSLRRSLHRLAKKWKYNHGSSEWRWKMTLKPDLGNQIAIANMLIVGRKYFVKAATWGLIKAKKTARWKRIDLWRLKTALDIPALLIIICASQIWNCHPTTYQPIFTYRFKIPKSSPHSVTALPPWGSLLLSEDGWVREVEKHRPVFWCHLQRPPFTFALPGLMVCKLKLWVKFKDPPTHLPHLLRASSHHGSPDAPKEKAGGSCAPSHILQYLGEPCLSYIGYDATTPLDFFLLLRIWTLIYYIVVSWSYTHAYYTTFKSRWKGQGRPFKSSHSNISCNWFSWDRCS